jgi:hypothetical protein
VGDVMPQGARPRRRPFSPPVCTDNTDSDASSEDSYCTAEDHLCSSASATTTSGDESESTPPAEGACVGRTTDERGRREMTEGGDDEFVVWRSGDGTVWLLPLYHRPEADLSTAVSPRPERGGREGRASS